MHDIYSDPMDLKLEAQYAFHDDDFGRHHMADVADMGIEHSPHSSPPDAYSAFDFTSPDGVTMETIYSRTFEPSFSAPLPLHPINTSILWPSQLTTPGDSGHTSVLPVLPSAVPVKEDHTATPPARASVPTLAPAPASVPAPPLTPASATAPPSPPSKSASTQSTHRKTLTDHDRRKMCEYHDENPTIKQTEIGAMFGVERSTVSKVLRNKEKYLIADDGRKSPVKRSKSKFPDIERTLSNWAKNRLSEGLPLDDKTIKDEARKFATTLGSSECSSQINDPVWLEKFKSKNRLPGAEKQEAKIETDRVIIQTNSGSQTPNGVSPTIGWDGMAVAQIKDEIHNNQDGIFDSSAWGHTYAQSVPSIGSCFSDGTFSADFRSPTPPFFSPLSSCGPSPNLTTSKSRLPTLAPASMKRRQTVPLIGMESPGSSSSQTTSQSSTSTLKVNPGPMDISSVGMEVNVQQSRKGHKTRTPRANNTSLRLMAPPPNMISPCLGSNTSSTSSPTLAPSQEEARAGLETFRNFIERQPHATMGTHDYMILGKWMHLLQSGSSNLPGGMQSIPMFERADGTVPTGRKRSEHYLSFDSDLPE